MAEVTREIVQDVVIAEQSVARVQSRRITIPRGTATGPHAHNGPVFGVVLSGTAFVQVDGGELVVVGAGETFFEPAEVRVDRFDGGGEELVFLAWFPLPADVEPELRLL